MAKVTAATDLDDDEVRKWRQEIEAFERSRESWNDRCDKIVKRYKDEREAIEKDDRRFNVLWSNIQTMRPALYGRVPTPIVERRFLDKDDTGRLASQLLERALRYQMEDSKFHPSIKRSVLDYLLSAQGTVWVRYDPTFGEPILLGEQGETYDHGEDADEGEYEAPQPSLLSEAVCVDFVHRKDFYAFPAHARTWDEVTAVGRRVFMTRDQLVKRFKDVGEQVTLDHTPDTAKDKKAEGVCATVWEIWCKPEKMVKWVAKSHPTVLDKKQDPLHLGGFWPCPEPLFGTLGNDDLIPTPDYVQYQDQAREIDELTARISLLQEALKVAGVYDQSCGDLQRLLMEGRENKLIPVSQWAMFAEKGGIKGAIQFLPIAEIATVLDAVLKAREQQKRDLYEITGVADIIRGQSDPDETLGAQKLKGQYVSLRLHDRQRDVARMCRDTIRIMGEIIAEHFQPDTLIQTAGAMYDDGLVTVNEAEVAQRLGQPASPAMPGMQAPVDPQMLAMAVEQAKRAKIEQAIALLRNDKLRGFRIEIETDSTIEADAAEEKSARIEFLTVTTTFMKNAHEIIQQRPEAAPLLGKMLLFAVRGMRVGRDLESHIEDLIEKSEQQLKTQQGQPKKPNPEQVKAESEIAAAKIEADSEATNAQLAIKGKEADFEIKQMEAANRQAELAEEREFKREQHAARMAELSARAQLRAVQASPIPQPLAPTGPALPPEILNGQ